jgi:UTP--glucose-1-phosphate uridylyltransferase
MSTNLANELSHLDPALKAKLNAHGFEAARLERLAETLGGKGAAPGADSPDALRASELAAEERARRNRVSGNVLPPRAEELLALPATGSTDEARLRARGHEALTRGEVAFCVMAGGMATRMGGVVKALVEALPGRTFLDLRLAENRSASARAGRPVPLWLMTSDATDGPIRDALAKANAPEHVRTFRQDLGLRLNPDGCLFRGSDGQPSPYATGHGDLPDALRRSGLLASFRKQGGKIVWIANLDNLGASLDERLLGSFLESGAEVLVEVCDKVAGDRGGIPVRAMGRLQVLEEFRLPADFDAAKVRVFNTNTFLVQAEPLETANLTWSWFYVEKKVEGRTAIQFERLLQELTANLRASYLRVPREGAQSRFLPVKDHDELARRRSEIEAVARERGMT